MSSTRACGPRSWTVGSDRALLTHRRGWPTRASSYPGKSNCSSGPSDRALQKGGRVGVKHACVRPALGGGRIGRMECTVTARSAVGQAGGKNSSMLIAAIRLWRGVQSERRVLASPVGIGPSKLLPNRLHVVTLVSLPTWKAEMDRKVSGTAAMHLAWMRVPSRNEDSPRRGWRWYQHAPLSGWCRYSRNSRR